MKNQEMDVENVGIMQGMADGMDELIEKLMSGEEPLEDGDDDEYETGKMIDRTPSSPEILMNNLRGDMRSVDARREELADMVGYNAAMETPDEVLALLQAQMAQDQMAGIGGLPQGAPPAMPQGMPPQGAPPMAQGPAPAGGIEALMGGAAPAQPPMQMADGGYVQSFADGSDEDGVTPFGSDSSSYFDPAIRDYASQQTLRFLQQQPRAVPDLRASMEERLPLYQELIGAGEDTRDMTQAQMLFALSQAAFNYAGNVDAQGRPLRGSQLARAAQAFAPVPGQIGALAAAQRKEDRAVKLAALQAAEKDVENVREANTKLIQSQRELWGDIAKSSGASAVWGKAGLGAAYNIINRPGLAERIYTGDYTPEEENLWSTAMAQIRGKARESTKEIMLPTGEKTFQTIPGVPIPAFAERADAARIARMSGRQPEVEQALPDLPTEAAVSAGITQALGGKDLAEIVPSKLSEPTAPTPMTQTQVEKVRSVDPLDVDPYTFNYGQPGEKTMFNLAGLGTGPLASFAAKIYGNPLLSWTGISELTNADVRREAYKTLTLAAEDVGTALRNSPRWAETERQQINERVALLPQFLDEPQAYISSLNAVENVLKNRQQEMLNLINVYRDVSDKDKQEARATLRGIHRIRKLMGTFPMFDSANDPNIQKLSGDAPIYVKQDGRWAVVPMFESPENPKIGELEDGTFVYTRQDGQWVMNRVRKGAGE